jgi:LacI family transcriptional regulator
MAKSVARLKDIAEQTGFSVNTVSLALRGSSRIPDETRTVILQTAERLNYLPNQVAQSLVRRETRSIGLILTDLENPVLTAVAQAVELELSKRGYTTLFATSNNLLAREAEMIETFRARRADGMLIFPCSHRQLDHIRALRKRNYPVVLLVGDPDAGIDAVCMDERTGAFKAVAHLINNGHTRIALIDGAATLGNTEKQEGYLRAYAHVGLEPDPRLMLDPKGASVASGFWAMDDLVGRKLDFSAVFAANDSLALGVLRYCSKNGLRVPEDISIVGFDNIEFGEYAITPISTINYDVTRVTNLAIERVLDLISASGVLPEARVTQVEPELVVRESSNRRYLASG